MKMNEQGEAGMTLVEMMISIAIGSILALKIAKRLQDLLMGLFYN